VIRGDPSEIKFHSQFWKGRAIFFNTCGRFWACYYSIASSSIAEPRRACFCSPRDCLLTSLLGVLAYSFELEIGVETRERLPLLFAGRLPFFGAAC